MHNLIASRRKGSPYSLPGDELNSYVGLNTGNHRHQYLVFRLEQSVISLNNLYNVVQITYGLHLSGHDHIFEKQN